MLDGHEGTPAVPGIGKFLSSIQEFAAYCTMAGRKTEERRGIPRVLRAVAEETGDATGTRERHGRRGRPDGSRGETASGCQRFAAGGSG